MSSPGPLRAATLRRLGRCRSTTFPSRSASRPAGTLGSPSGLLRDRLPAGAEPLRLKAFPDASQAICTTERARCSDMPRRSSSISRSRLSRGLSRNACRPVVDHALYADTVAWSRSAIYHSFCVWGSFGERYGDARCKGSFLSYHGESVETLRCAVSSSAFLMPLANGDLVGTIRSARDWPEAPR